MIHPLLPSVAQRIDLLLSPTELLGLIPRHDVTDHQRSRVEPALAVDHEVARLVVGDWLRWLASALTRQPAALPIRRITRRQDAECNNAFRNPRQAMSDFFVGGSAITASVGIFIAGSSEGFDHGWASSAALSLLKVRIGEKTAGRERGGQC
jgi:hypothetical protein